MDKLEFNPTIIEVVKSSNIPKDDGLTVLTCLYFNLNAKMFEDKYYQDILAILGTKFIFNRDSKTGKVQWLVSLFGDDSPELEWIKEFMDMFGKLNPDRRGVRKETIARLEQFRVQHPLYTKEDIMNAAKHYLNSADPRFCFKSHKFILNETGSPLLTYLEYLHKEKDDSKVL
jgi:hypothetical protein